MSNKAKHTPGPWMVPHFAVSTHPCTCSYVLGGDYMGSIATVQHDGMNIPNAEEYPPVEEAKANAHLIASAPDLYEALGSLLFEFDSDPYGCAFCGAKCSANWDENTPKDCKHAEDCVSLKARAALAKARGCG